MDVRGYIEQFSQIAMTGLNLRPGQSLAIKAEPEHIETVAAVAEAAYRRGARYVDFWPESSRLRRSRLDHSSEEHLDFVPEHRAHRIDEFIRDKWALLSIKSPTDLSIMDGVDAGRSGRVAQSVQAVDSPLRRALGNDETQWTVMAVPSAQWAADVLGIPAGDEALLAMWNALDPILRLSHENPAEYWKHHGDALKRRCATLDELSVQSLHVTAPGTDVVIPLHKTAQWLGGGSVTRDGLPFLPNIPTEEVFTAPYAPGVSGRLAVTRPVRVYGSVVRNAWFEFDHGSVVDFGAEQGRDTLEMYLGMDEGSRRMGEIALVDSSSPIAQSGLVFQNILLDENAACHFALGSAYPTCLQGGESMSDEQLVAVGANRSHQHVDFMIGSDYMDIDATSADGSSHRIMEKGRLTL
ncbi:MAG TPA: aminopeptidase [Alkalispirochaeta sp.]|nr:aminopeptidase [Alkalispirochaeta sp.]